MICGRKTERGQLGIRRHVAALVYVLSNQPGNVGVAADKVVRKERMRRTALVGDPVDRRRQWFAVFVQSLRCAGLAVVLLHVAALAIAFEVGVVILIAGAVGVGAVGPLGIGSFDGESAHPLAQRVLDGQGVGHIMTGGAHLGAHKHRLVIPLVFGWIDLLEGDIA